MPGQSAIGDGLSVGDLLQSLPDAALKERSGRAQREAEHPAQAGKVFQKLAFPLGEQNCFMLGNAGISLAGQPEPGELLVFLCQGERAHRGVKGDQFHRRYLAGRRVGLLQSRQQNIREETAFRLSSPGRTLDGESRGT